MNYQEFIKPELLVLIPVLYMIGLGLKKSLIPDKWIPLLLGTVSVVLTTLWVIANSDTSSPRMFILALFTSFTQGILAAGMSVYANELYHQAKKDE